ncbi:MAG: antirestriction protein ArdA [Gammaproteobacteria bacterium SHHR-1]
MSTETISRIYVGTYAKYNSGNLAGDWLDLDDYDSADEFYKAALELHTDESDPELMFQDWEGIPREYISESSLSPEFFARREIIEKSYLDEEVFNAAAELDIPADQVEDAYVGSYSSDEDFAYELAEGCGYLAQMPKAIRYYFDANAFARDLMINDYQEQDGHYFRRDW